MVQKIKLYILEIWLELRRVNWLTRQESIKYTLIVIGVSVGIAAILGFFDLIFNFGIEKLIV